MLVIDEVSIELADKYEAVDSPTASDIDKAMKLLKSDSGTVTLQFNENETFSVHSHNGDYFLVEANGKEGLTLLLTDKRISLPKKANLLPIYGNECLEHNTITDFESVLNVMNVLIQNAKFTDLDPFEWVNVNIDSSKERFNY